MSETVVLTRWAQVTALAVQLVGYIPAESLVVVTTRRGRVGPVAVTELPTVPDELATGPAADQVATLLRRHGDAAVLVVFTGSPPLWSEPVRRLAGQLAYVAEIAAVLHADADSYGSYGDGAGGSWSLDDLPTAARLAALRPVLPSRDTLGAALDPERGGRMIASDLFTGAADDQAGLTSMMVARRAMDLLAEAFTLAETGRPLPADRAARLIVALAGDALTRFTATAAAVSAAAQAAHRAATLSALTMLVGATPADLIGGTAPVLAYAAYVGGDGPLTNLAIDRMLDAGTVPPAVHALAALIQAATPPAEVKALIDAVVQRLRPDTPTS